MARIGVSILTRRGYMKQGRQGVATCVTSTRVVR